MPRRAVISPSCILGLWGSHTPRELVRNRLSGACGHKLWPNAYRRRLSRPETLIQTDSGRRDVDRNPHQAGRQGHPIQPVSRRLFRQPWFRGGGPPSGYEISPPIIAPQLGTPVQRAESKGQGDAPSSTAPHSPPTGPGTPARCAAETAPLTHTRTGQPSRCAGLG